MKSYFITLKKHWVAICLLLITLIGLALRLYRLGYQGIFAEEISTLNENSLSYYQILLNSFTVPQSGEAPLFFLIDRMSVDISGFASLVALRLPAAILGTFCIPAIYALGKEYRDELTGLFAAITIALSERMIFYSQYARPYSAVFLFFIMATFCFLKLEKGEPAGRWMPLLILTSGLCLWTHFYSVFPLLIFWGILICHGSSTILRYAMVALVSAAGAFLFYARALLLNLIQTPAWLIRPPSIYNVTWIDIMFRVPYECWGYVVLLVVPLFLIWLWSSRDRIAGYFGLAAGATYVITMLLTIITDPSARYAALIAPLIIVPALVPVSQFVEKRVTPAQKIIGSTGWIYLILAANFFPLVAWYTTAYHFVFV